MMLAMTLESCVSRFRGHKTSARKTARQADSILHLLRMALTPGGEPPEAGTEFKWLNGSFDVPIRTQVECERPLCNADGLSTYYTQTKYKVSDGKSGEESEEQFEEQPENRSDSQLEQRTVID
jgi:hypothetical protein